MSAVMPLEIVPRIGRLYLASNWNLT